MEDKQARTSEKAKKQNWWEVDAAELNELLASAERLGGGTFGDVFKVKWQGRFVAVKRFRQGSPEDWQRELKIMRTNPSEYLVQFLTASITSSPYLIVTEYMDGGSLYDILKKNGPLDWPTAKRYAHDILLGLIDLHRRNLFHRDMKTDNILITHERGSRAKIGDFGTAKVVDIKEVHSFQGTICFMAPEVLQNQPDYTTKVDIYSFGHCLYEMVVGISSLRSLQHTVGIVQLANCIVGNLRPAFPRNVKLPEGLRDLIERCWDANPDQRPTAQEGLDMLDAIPITTEGERLPILDAIALTTEKAPSQQQPGQEYLPEGVKAFFEQSALLNTASWSMNDIEVGLRQNAEWDDFMRACNKPSIQHLYQNQMKELALVMDEYGMRNKDTFHEGRMKLIEAAFQGGMREQFVVGWMLQHGVGSQENPSIAFYFYQCASLQGYAAAQYTLGDLHGEGIVLKKDDWKALELYHLAAEQGYAAAQYKLGRMYLEGRGGLDRNERKAVELFHSAAEHGYAPAQLYLGMMFDEGRGGLNRNEKKASELYKLAADGKDV